MSGKKKLFALYDLWEFESFEELKVAAEKECHVCGDRLCVDEEKQIIEISNWHRGDVRWKGYVKK